jgi:hypothetical protein
MIAAGPKSAASPAHGPWRVLTIQVRSQRALVATATACARVRTLVLRRLVLEAHAARAASCRSWTLRLSWLARVRQNLSQAVCAARERCGLRAQERRAGRSVSRASFKRCNSVDHVFQGAFTHVSGLRYAPCRGRSGRQLERPGYRAILVGLYAAVAWEQML